jgi:hypothetical protein
MSGREFNIFDAMASPHVWRSWFSDERAWRNWRTFLACLFGLPINEYDLALVEECAQRTRLPEGGFTEAWLICGRRAGKSFILSLVACFLAIFRDWRPYLAPGEMGTIKIIATDRKQAKVIHRYCKALLMEPPSLAELVTRVTDELIELNNGISIEIQSASFRSVRGFTVIAALLDEIAWWRTDEGSAVPDSEILAAIRPTMATIPGAMLLCASSPYARRGELWKAYRQHYGQNSSTLVWQAATRVMNQTVPQSVIDQARRRTRRTRQRNTWHNFAATLKALFRARWSRRRLFRGDTSYRRRSRGWCTRRLSTPRGRRLTR